MRIPFRLVPPAEPRFKSQRKRVPLSAEFRPDTRVLFLGSLVPDTAAYRTSAFSRAGHLAQLGLVQGLQSAGVDILQLTGFLAVPTFPRSKRWVVKAETLELSGVPTRLAGFVNLPLLKPWSLTLSLTVQLHQALRRWSKAERCIVLTYNFNTFVALPALWARFRGADVVPVLFDVDIPGHTVPDTLARRLDAWLLRRLLRHVDAAVVITQGLADDLLNVPSLVVEGGLGATQIQHYTRTYSQGTATERQQTSTFNIVLAGALEPYNGVDVLIEAFQALPDPDARLLIAGRGSLEPLLKQAAALDPRIQPQGYLDANGMAKLYQRASVLINHRSDARIDSRYVFPSKLIEYLATGTPIISTVFRSLRQEYQPYLVLLPDETPAALTLALQTVKHDPDSSQQRARAGQNFVLQEKSWERQGHRIARFIDLLFTGPIRRPRGL